MYQPPGAQVAASLFHGMPNFTHYCGDGARFPLKRKKNSLIVSVYISKAQIIENSIV